MSTEKSPIELALEAGDEMRRLLWRHLAMPLVDHDGGDEDDRLVRERQFLRAAIKPGAIFGSQGDRLIVVNSPSPLSPLMPMSFKSATR